MYRNLYTIHHTVGAYIGYAGKTCQNALPIQIPEPSLYIKLCEKLSGNHIGLLI